MKQEFKTIIRQHDTINGAYVEIPFDVHKVFGVKRVKVIATFDGFEYRGSIVSMGGRYLLGITQQIRKEIHKVFGDTIKVTVEKDEAKRMVELPSEFERKLKENGSAKSFWYSLSFSNKKKYADWMNSAKKAETQTQRIEKSISMLENKTKVK